MNDIERLTEALRRANAELEVDPHELADAVHHARRRLLGRLLVVAALSSVGALLLLSGGLAASQAVKDNPSKGSKGAKDPGKKTHHQADEKRGNEGNNPSDGHSQNGAEGSRHHKDKQATDSNLDSGKSTEEKEGLKVVQQPNLRVNLLTPTKIEVVNEGDAPSGRFEVMVIVEPAAGAPFEEPVRFGKLAPEGSEALTFGKEPICEKGDVLFARVDPGFAIRESNEDDNETESEQCELSGETGEKIEEKPSSEEESTTSTVPASPAASAP